MLISTDMTVEEITKLLNENIYLKPLDLEEAGDDEMINQAVAEAKVEAPPEPVVEEAPAAPKPDAGQPSASAASADTKKAAVAQHVISVNVSKLDSLLNLMGELVIAEAMVTQNPELDGLELESFVKEARQLHKIINDIQDTVMSMRMVPLQSTFFKMHRIVRDMCRQLNKEVELIIIGEDTEVDKNIIEHISDPLMHIIRNSVDHGIEMPEERKAANKTEKGKVILEAKNTGGDVLIIVRDDGSGLNKKKILAKAKSSGLLRRDESEYSDKEIHQFIFLPGFSTNDKVTSFSGRGVGMDVVSTNLELVGGSVSVDSVPDEGSTFTLKIPLTLAIIEGMTIRMGGAKYTIPIISMVKSFKASESAIFRDPSGNEMITERGEVYNVVRLYEFFGVESEITNIEDGIMVMLENGEQTVCLFVDDLIGEQQVVVKSMPKYIKKIRGISGCTLLGNGDISLIIDVGGFFDK
jgi:two-component system chemotaxis sensor kinase CheA